MRAWLDDAHDGWRPLVASFFAMFVPIHLHQPFLVCAAVWFPIWIVTSLLDDLCALVYSLHDCVHDAAGEAAREANLQLLRGVEEAKR